MTFYVTATGLEPTTHNHPLKKFFNVTIVKVEVNHYNLP